MGAVYFFRSLNYPKRPLAPRSRDIRRELKKVGVKPGYGGIVTALRRLPQQQYDSLISFLGAVFEDVQVPFRLKLPSLALILGGENIPPIDFQRLREADNGTHLTSLVNNYFDYHDDVLDLRYLPAYLRTLRNANGRQPAN